MVTANLNFRPYYFKWVIVKNKRYDVLRTYEGFENFQDIDQVDQDAETVIAGIKGLGAGKMDIVECTNYTFDDFKQLFRGLRNTVEENWNNKGNRKTFIFFYYAGHGVTDKFLRAVCNGAFNKEGERLNKPSQLTYDIESACRGLGETEGGYCVGVYDCCREMLNLLTRGGIAQSEVPE